MKIVKVNRLKTSLLSSEEISHLNELFRKAKKGKIKYVKNHLYDLFNPESVFEDFNELDKVTKLDLNIMFMLINIGKILYSNGKKFIDEVPYDLGINKYKEFRPEPIVEMLSVSRRTHDKVHEFPELKGTLDKKQKIYESEIESKLERAVETFIRKCFSISVKNKIYFLLSKKYDGNSVVLTIENGKVKEAVTRGEEGKGADLFHLFKDLKFKDDKKYRGIQFEICITKSNYEKYCEDKGTKYDNLRTAVTSILTSTDGVKYAKYLTLVPLRTSDGLDPYDLNNYYATDINFEYSVISACGPNEALEKIQLFASELSDERDDLNFAIDGVVIDCMDEDVRNSLGRKNDINQYQTAYKFPPQERITTVTELKFTVGRTGIIIPMIYYEAIYFNGGKHTHSSLSSYDRFKRLNLRVGDKIRITYNGDVMPYVSKYNCKENDNNTKPYLVYPTKCKCGSKLVPIGANLYCKNDKCYSKQLPAISHFYTTLGVRDMKEKKVAKLLEVGVISGLEDGLNPKYKAMHNVEGFGEKTINNFREQLYNILETKIDEARLMKALGISGERTARAILSIVPLDAIFKNPQLLFSTKIQGIGDITKKTFLEKLQNTKHIIDEIRKQMKVVEVKATHDKVIICFTGFRDKKLKVLLEAIGFEVADSYTKKVSYVIRKDESYHSSTLAKAEKDNKQILTLAEFKNTMLKDMEVDM